MPEIKRTGKAQLVVKAHMEDGAIETAVLGKVDVRPDMPRSELDIDGAKRRHGAARRHLHDDLQPAGRTISPADRFHSRRPIPIGSASFATTAPSRSNSPRFRRSIAGDSRFHLHRNRENLGFYHNFEAVLADVPPEAEFVALSDQDDVWHPDKLGGTSDRVHARYDHWSTPTCELSASRAM